MSLNQCVVVPWCAFSSPVSFYPLLSLSLLVTLTLTLTLTLIPNLTPRFTSCPEQVFFSPFSCCCGWNPVLLTC